MVYPDEPAALAYIEKTLADSYRKEIDQEENVWRSLPFFAATLALQLAALFQMIDKLPAPNSLAGQFSIAFLSLAGLFTLTSLGFLASSIYPQKFDYLPQEPLLLAYAQELIRKEQDPANQDQQAPFSALVTLKTALCSQYAKGADHNRQINKWRERRRSIAGLAALGSVLMTVFLVGAAYSHYLLRQVQEDRAHETVQALAARAAPAQPGPDAARLAIEPGGPTPTPDAGGH